MMNNLGPVLILCNFTSWFVLILVSVCHGVKFCGEEGCELNKTCQYQFAEASPNCVEYKRITEDDIMIAAILNRINMRRSHVAMGTLRSLPPASNMRKMEWSEELAASAQTWADQCHPHSVPDYIDTCRDRDGAAVGQSVASVVGDAPGLTAPALVDVWYTELLNANATVVSEYQPSVEVSSSHYDYFCQLAWAETYQVGCGGVKFLDTAMDRNRTIHRLVCNFFPAGNIPGAAVYDAGRPCARCPAPGLCDQQYPGLCATATNISASHYPEISSNTSKAIEMTTENDITESFAVATEPDHATNTTTFNTTDITESTNDETITMFDYFSHIHEFTKQAITFKSSEGTKPCKDVLAIDNLLELLKKKIITDPYFKDILTTRKSNEQNETIYSDASVAAFVNHLYSKKTTETTTKPNDEYFNSTLLADLVEAVMFRSGDKYSQTEALEQSTRDTPEISPVKIQAELAQSAINNDFTGHYFFPEEDEEEQSTSETTESYYDTSIRVSDVVLELDDLRRNSGTRDFVDEILDSESVSESSKTTSVLLPDNMVVYKSGHDNMKKFLEEIGERRDKVVVMTDFSVRNPLEEGTKNTPRRKRHVKSHKSNIGLNQKGYSRGLDVRKSTKTYGKDIGVATLEVIDYMGLLQKLAKDIKMLRFNERFHCSYCNCNAVIIDVVLVLSLPSFLMLKHVCF